METAIDRPPDQLTNEELTQAVLDRLLPLTRRHVEYQELVVAVLAMVTRFRMMRGGAIVTPTEIKTRGTQ